MTPHQTCYRPKLYTVISLLLLSCFYSGSAFAQSTYTITNLNPVGAIESRAAGINESGQVVGSYKTSDGHSHAFLWQNGSFIDLGALGGLDSIANDINELGQVIGTASTADNQRHAFLWSDANNNGVSDPGEMIDLGTLGGVRSDAIKINNSGQVVGFARISSGASYPFVWADANNNGQSDPGEMIKIEPAGSSGGEAYGINDSGQVVGQFISSDGYYHLFRYESGIITDLGTSPFGGDVIFGNGINKSGQIAGDGNYPDFNTYQAFLYQNGTFTPLGTLGGPSSGVLDLNDKGEVVGGSDTSSGVEHAFLYSNGMIDLNSVLPVGSGWELTLSFDVNNQSQIVGRGNYNGQTHAFLLTPTESVAVPVMVDIKPGEANEVNLKSKGTIPVAIMSTSNFDVTKADPATIRLAGAPVSQNRNGKWQVQFLDIDGDGLNDIIVNFYTEQLLLTPADSRAIIEGSTADGQLFRGTDVVNVLK